MLLQFRCYRQDLNLNILMNFSEEKFYLSTNRSIGHRLTWSIAFGGRSKDIQSKKY